LGVDGVIGSFGMQGKRLERAYVPRVGPDGLSGAGARDRETIHHCGRMHGIVTVNKK
jgi:hypothetical protein